MSETDHAVGAPARVEPFGESGARRAEIDGHGEAPQHGPEALAEIVEGPAQQKLRIAIRQRPLQAAAHEGSVEDERRGHLPDMA